MKNPHVQVLETNLGPLASLAGTDPGTLKMLVFDLAIFTVILNLGSQEEAVGIT